MQVERRPGFKVINGPTTSTVVVALNNSRAPLNDVRVRRAISHAINREEIIIGAEFGFGTPIGSHMTPAEPYYADMTGVYPYDPAKARALLQEAGYGDGLRLTLSLPNQYTYAVRAGELVADQLRRVGIHVDIELVEWATWLSRIFGEADYDMTVIGHAEPMDIGIYANPGYYFRYDGAARARTAGGRPAVRRRRRAGAHLPANSGAAGRRRGQRLALRSAVLRPDPCGRARLVGSAAHGHHGPDPGLHTALT